MLSGTRPCPHHSLKSHCPLEGIVNDAPPYPNPLGHGITQSGEGAERFTALQKGMLTIPILRLVGAAYGFAFGHWFTILRLSWFWLLLPIMVWLMLGRGVAQAIRAYNASGNPDELSSAVPSMLLIYGLQFAAMPAIVVALTRVVVTGDRRPGVPLHLWTGRPELRVLAALLLTSALLFVVSSIGNAAMTAFGGPGAVGGVLLPVTAILTILAIMWLATRLSLAPAIASIEPVIGLERSWRMTQGQSARLFLAALLTFLPLLLAASMIMGLFVLPAVGPMPVFDPNDAAASSLAQREWMVRVLNVQFANPLSTGLSQGLFNLLLYGLYAGLFGSVYRLLAGEPEEKPES